MKLKIIYIILLLLAFHCCKEDNESLDNQGKIVFYTNAQVAYNCGPFDVVIYINGDSIGTVSEPYTGDKPSPQEGNPYTLVLDMEPGKYFYSAKFSCGLTSGTWDGDFQVGRSGPLYIFLDIDKCNIKTNQND